MNAIAPDLDVRVDPFLGTVVNVVRSRQARPNLPGSGCPFCVGGLEAPEPYDVRWFPNRWPALGEGRCEVVLYTPRHDATFASLGPVGARRVVDLWADRTEELRKLPGVQYVLVFENRGSEVGATIAHPHGQIYAYDHVPDRLDRRLRANWRPEPQPGERSVIEATHWRVWVNAAPVHPVSLCIAPRERIADLPSASDAQRDSLAGVLVDIVDRLDRLHGVPMPYMMWVEQAPTHGAPGTLPWCNIEIVSPWRANGVQRFIAAAELAGGEYFNPVSPEDVAAALRALPSR